MLNEEVEMGKTILILMLVGIVILIVDSRRSCSVSLERISLG